MPDKDHEERIDLIFEVMLASQPYDCEANEIVAFAIKDFLTEHPDHIAEFEEWVLTFNPEEMTTCEDHFKGE